MPCFQVQSSKEEPSNKHQPRSDSPVLEGIDQELAKYAKLKDLKQAYNSEEGGGGVKPKKESGSSSCSSSISPPASAPSNRRRRSDHVPDGASNPDLNHKVPQSGGEKQLCMIKNEVVPRRSPGTSIAPGVSIRSLSGRPPIRSGAPSSDRN